MSGSSVKRLASAGALALALLPATAVADIAADDQALLLLRVLAFDRNLRSRAGGAVTIAIMFKPGLPESENARDQMVAALQTVGSRVSVAALPVRVLAIASNDAARLASVRPAAVYVCPGAGDDVRDIVAVARRESILSFSAVESFVRAGLGVGIVARGSRRVVLVNLPVARLEGANLDARLLGIAEVIQ